nr:hypothetical protein GGBNIMDK_00065 [Bacillus cereus]
MYMKLDIPTEFEIKSLTDLSNFRAYINKKPEFKKYFKDGKRIALNSPGKVRYETPPGEQAQLDWKEKYKI